MNGIGTQTDGRADGRGRLNFEIPLIASLSLSPLHPSGVCRCGSSLSLHFLILIRPLRESDLNPASLIAGLAATHAAGGALVIHFLVVVREWHVRAKYECLNECTWANI